MLTVGVDLAAQAANTSLAAIAWDNGTARVVELFVGCDDEAIVAAVGGAEKVGIDCPFGWPLAFHQLLIDHHDGHVTAPEDVPGKQWRLGLTYRTTDLVTWREHGRRPLSVSADLIAHPAMRCTALLGRLARAGFDVSRDGSGQVVETYPAASLNRWGLPFRGYKGATGAPVRRALVDALCVAAPWLALGSFDEACRASDHALDALVAALTARAVVQGHTAGPAPDQAAAATVEGWIHVPSGDLDDMSPGTPNAAG